MPTNRKMKKSKKYRRFIIIAASVLLFSITIFIIIDIKYTDVLQRHEYEEDIVTRGADCYRSCQTYHRYTNKKFSMNYKQLNCGCPEDAKIYESDFEFRKDYPHLCLPVSLGVTPDSFTVIIAGNVDGKDEFRYSSYPVGIPSPRCW